MDTESEVRTSLSCCCIELRSSQRVQTDKKSQRPNWYKWILLAAASISQIFCSGYVVGTVTLLSVFYEDRFQDRKLSGVIGTTQMALSLFIGLPAVYVNRRIGERWMQVIGGCLMTVGIGATAFTSSAWQAVLATGVCSGVGAAMLRTSTYSITAKYFPGYQLLPYAALMICFNLGTMVLPPITSAAMNYLTFDQAVLLLAGLVSINIIAGALFLPIDAEESQKKEKVEPNRVLKFKDHRKGIYILPQLQTEENKFTAQSEVSSVSSELDSFHRTASYLYLYNLHSKEYEESLSNQSVSPTSSEQDIESKADAEEDEKDSVVDANNNISEAFSSKDFKTALCLSHGENIAELIHVDKKTGNKLLTLLRNPLVLIYLVYAFSNSFSTVAFSSLAGDYTKHELQFTNDQFSIGITVMGTTSLISAVFYLIFTHFFSFSSTFLQIFATTSKGITYFTLLAISTPMEFYVLMGIYGFTKSFGNMYACCMEIGSPENAVLMYMLELMVDGIAGIAVPFLATYLQVDVDPRAGFYLAGAVIIVGTFCFLPVSLRSFCAPKVYEQDQFDKSLDVKGSEKEEDEEKRY